MCIFYINLLKCKLPFGIKSLISMEVKYQLNIKRHTEVMISGRLYAYEHMQRGFCFFTLFIGVLSKGTGLVAFVPVHLVIGYFVCLAPGLDGYTGMKIKKRSQKRGMTSFRISVPSGTFYTNILMQIGRIFK